MPEVLLYRMNKHKSHSSSLGFSTSWCVELCFELNTCHRCCQISWINAVAQIITSLVFRDETDSRWQSVCVWSVHAAVYTSVLGEKLHISQAQRIKGEVGRTVSLLGCCLRDAYRNWTQQRRHQTTCIMESCHPGPLSGEEVNQRLEVTVWLKISGLWMMNARWSLVSAWEDGFLDTSLTFCISHTKMAGIC